MSPGTDERIGAGYDHDGIVGIGDGDDGRPAMGPGGVLDEREIDALRGEKRAQLLPESIRADSADQRDRRAELGGGHRLVGTLAARKIMHGLAGDGLADPRMPAGGRHHIHVDAAGDEDAPYITSQNCQSQNSFLRPIWNSCLTASISASVGNPASLPRRWIL